MVTLLLPLSLWLAGDRVPALAGAEPSEFVGNWARQTSGGPAAGKFLVADRKLGDPNFARTVVLILGHGTRGSTGLIVNRQSLLRLPQVLPGHPRVAGREDLIYQGGPVQAARLMVLARGQAKLEDAVSVFADVSLVTTRAGLAATLDLGLPEDSIRAYAGHAGWASGQLDREIARGDWRVVDASVEQVFSRNPNALWQKLTDETIGKWVHLGPRGLPGWDADMEDAASACHGWECLPVQAES